MRSDWGPAFFAKEITSGAVEANLVKATSNPWLQGTKLNSVFGEATVGRFSECVTWKGFHLLSTTGSGERLRFSRLVMRCLISGTNVARMYSPTSESAKRLISR